MKNRFFWILSALLLWAINTRGASISATITVTNLPTSGATLVINGNTRTWTNTASSPVASWILIGDGSIGSAATNLYNHIAANPYVGPFLTLGRVGTNAISLFSPNGVLAITTNEWMEVTYSTNQTTSVYALSVPPWNVPGNTNRTNNGHWLVDYLNDYVYTNAIRTNANVASNYLTRGASPQQYVASPVQFNGTVRAAGGIFGTNGILVSTTNVNPVLSNGVNYGNAFRSEGSGGNSFQVGSNAQALGALSLAAGNNATATNTSDAAIGNGAIASGGSALAAGNGSAAIANGSTAIGTTASASGNSSVSLGAAANASAPSAIAIGLAAASSSNYSIAIGDNAISSAYSSSAIGQEANASAVSAIAIGPFAVSAFSNSVAIGKSASTSSTNQLMLGTSTERVSIPGILLISGTQSNTTFRGTNIAGGSWSFPRADLSSIANGNNISIPIGTNQFVRLSGSVSAAPTLCGFIGAATSGGTDGQWVTVHNDLGYALTLAQNTVDPVAANRIETADGNDASIIANGWWEMRYSTSDSRWHIENTYPFTISASATNAISSVQTNESAPAFIGSLLTNLLFSTGVTGYLSGATAILGVSIPPGTSTNALVSTNGTTLSAAVGTFDFVSGITGYVSGAKALLGVDQGLLLGGKVDELAGVSTNLTSYGLTVVSNQTNVAKVGINEHLYVQGGYYVAGITTNANDAYFQSSIWQGISGGATLRADLLRVSGTAIFTNTVQTLGSLDGAGAFMGTVYSTNDLRSLSNAFFFGTNDFYKTVRFVNVATNKLLFNDANTNLVGLGLGANLSISGGNLVASGSGGGGDFNVNQFSATTATNIKSGALLTNIITYGWTNNGAGSNSGRFDVAGNVYSGTNFVGDGTNLLRYLKISGGIPASSMLRLDGGTNLAAATLGGNLTFDGTTLSGSGGTNFPAQLNMFNSTNINVGLAAGVRQSWYMWTNASFKMTFTGTPLNGEVIQLEVLNTNFPASVLYMTNLATIYDPSVGSNVTVFALPPQSSRFFTFVSSTNSQGAAGQRWVVTASAQREPELAVASIGGNGFLALSTNAAVSIITISNSYMPQASSLVLSNLVTTPAATNGGWGVAVVSGTATQTNRMASVATNATSVTLDFSDAVNINTLNTWFHLTTNLVVSPTNLIRGRTMCVYFDTNSLTYDVVITNTAATQVRWNFNVSTNGSTSFTKTNSLRARVFLTYETNDVLTAEMGYYR